MNQYKVFLLLSPIAVASSLVALIVCVVHRRGRGSIYLEGLLACSLAILIANILELTSFDPGHILVLSHITYVFLALTPVFWFVFSYQYSVGHSKDIGGLFAALCVVPLLTIAIACTNQMHHLLWRRNEIETIGSFRVNVVLEYGPWFWVHFAYSYLLYMTGAFSCRDGYQSASRGQSHICVSGRPGTHEGFLAYGTRHQRDAFYDQYRKISSA